VVGGVVNGVDTDGVDAELLEVLNIALASGLIGQRVSNTGLGVGASGTAGLVVDTTDEESLIAGIEGWAKGSASSFD
jgi:hypothetical protein